MEERPIMPVVVVLASVLPAPLAAVMMAVPAIIIGLNIPTLHSPMRASTRSEHGRTEEGKLLIPSSSSSSPSRFRFEHNNKQTNKQTTTTQNQPQQSKLLVLKLNTKQIVNLV